VRRRKADNQTHWEETTCWKRKVMGASHQPTRKEGGREGGREGEVSVVIPKVRRRKADNQTHWEETTCWKRKVVGASHQPGGRREEERNELTRGTK